MATLKYSLFFCSILLPAFAVGCTSGGVDQGAYDRDVMRQLMVPLLNPATRETGIITLINEIRNIPPGAEEADAYVTIANSEKYAFIRRRHAVFQLFDRHIRPGMDLGTVSSLLKGASWLKKGSVTRVLDVTGSLPIEIVDGQSIFVITPGYPDVGPPAICLRMGGEMSPEELYRALRHELSNASKYRITAIGFMYSLDNQELLSPARDMNRDFRRRTLFMQE